MISLKIISIIVGIYFVWALFHHLRSKSFSLQIMLEYILTALLIIIIALALT